MDRLSLIVTGAIVGMKDTAEALVKDAYAALRHLMIIERYGSRGDVQDALEKG
jgi:hypothetical protein